MDVGIKEFERETSIKLRDATVLLLLGDGEVLLAMKKRGFGVGKWNGVGGKPEQDEDILSAAIREAKEEIGVTPVDPKKVAVFKYYFPHDNFGMQVYIFTANEWSGDPIETEEMRPQWFSLDEIPYSEMWSDDEVWMPKVLEGLFLSGSFMFDEAGEILDHYLEEVSFTE